MNILYYPEINVPKTDWAIRAFLYYDEVAAIVPYSYNQSPELYEPFMRNALLNELVTPVDPMMYLHNIESVSEIFLRYVRNIRSLNYRRAAFRLQNRFRMHPGKFRQSIYDALVDQGLAAKSGEWYEVERMTANDMMFYLATALACRLDSRLSTDRMAFVRSPKHIDTPDCEIMYQNRRRNCILKELVPAPKTYDLSLVRRFKDNNHELLRSFRNNVESIALNQDIDPDSEHFSIIMDQLKQEKEELAARMCESRFGEIVFGKVCGVLASVTGASALLNAVYDACRTERPDLPDARSGMKYIVMADRSLVRK